MYIINVLQQTATTYVKVKNPTEYCLISIWPQTGQKSGLTADNLSKQIQLKHLMNKLIDQLIDCIRV